ncbi:hypothetical protein [Deefgea sp. CFH1-16]|uniref:hypothetical protein n=1 Tax=Deefgea sp. CFH1-16 TaxID=2675457 RepID=UPI0015F7276B|nr:hypothetical protein [Deefgea sp. CFH1-16]MBM5574427.1 hypothetical protein [Deefgea sp. CFH1-16]
MQEKLNSEHTLAAHQHLKLTQKFCVADLTEIPEGGQLARIILRLENEGKLNPLDEPYLNRYDLLAIADFSFGKINNDEFTIAISNRTSNKKQALAERFIEEHKVLQCEIDVLQRKKLARQHSEKLQS